MFGSLGAGTTVTNLVSQTSSNAKRLKDFYEDFQATLKDVFLQLADDEQDTIDFLGYEGLEKGGTAFTALFETFSSEQQTVFGLLMDGFTTETKMHDTLNRAAIS